MVTPKVEGDDVVPLVQEPLNHEDADRADGPGDEDPHPA
jgi:hypothetical protein